MRAFCIFICTSFLGRSDPSSQPLSNSQQSRSAYLADGPHQYGPIDHSKTRKPQHAGHLQTSSRIVRIIGRDQLVKASFCLLQLR